MAKETNNTEKLKSLFNQHETINEFYVTSDGLAFSKENDAQNHAVRLADRKYELVTTTDNEAAMFWYKDAVEFAFGGVEAFEKIGDPQFYGDVYSFLARTGSRARRVGYEGIALLQQAPSS